MKQKLVVVLVLLLLMVTACGANPVEKLEEAAAEQIAETIIEQSTGIEDIEINTDDGSVSYSVEDEDGNNTSISTSTEAEDVKAINGMGFNIPLPDGLVDGYVQQIDENGEAVMITGTFTAVDLTAAQFAESIHTSLTSQGFAYTDTSGSGKDRPDPTNELDMLMFGYDHPDGYVFTVLWGDGGTILGLSRTEPSQTSTSAGSDSTNSADESNNDSDSADTTTDTTIVEFDGSINADKSKYATSEQIKVTLNLDAIDVPLAEDAWVGIVPADTPHGSETENDAVDIDYAYVSNAEDGVVMLEAPYDAGHYDIRLFSTDADGVELDSISIVVE